MTGVIHTVLGPIDPADAGRVMLHEHPLSLTPGPWLEGGSAVSTADPRSLATDAGDPQYVRDQVDRAVGALQGLARLGFGTVVDLSPYGVVGRMAHGENVGLLREVSRRTGLHVVTGTSVYLEAYSPAWAVEADLDALTERMVADLTTGVGRGDVRAGILGEQATGLGEITAHEEKCLRAAARAHRRTGAAILTHTTHGTMALDQVAILREEGADLDRVVIGHMDTQLDLDLVLSVLEAGAGVAIDTIGKQHWDFFLAPPDPDPAEGEYTKRAFYRDDRARADLLVELVRRGYTERIVLAQDLTGAEVYLNPTTHGQWGYAYLASVFIPMAIERGLPPAAVDVLLRETPTRLLTVP